MLLPAKVGAGLLGAFGLLALSLAAVGIFGVRVEQCRPAHARRSGFGRPSARVRRPSSGGCSAARLATSRGARPSASCSPLDSVKLITSFLYGVSPADPITFAIVPAVLALAAALAGAVPARRAARVDPVVALRTE